MGISGTPRKRHHKWKFVVEIGGVASAWFQSMTELSAEAAVVAISEGGAMTPHKEPGRVTVANVTLSRGAANDYDLWTWWQEVANLAANTGEVTDDYKRDFDLVQQDRDGTVLVRWRLYRAFPVKYSAGDWDNEADEYRIESMDLAFDRFEPIT